jgi:hypothetical protein
VVMCCASGPGCPNCARSGDGGAGGGVGSGSVAIAGESGSPLGFSTRQPAAARSPPCSSRPTRGRQAGPLPPAHVLAGGMGRRLAPAFGSPVKTRARPPSEWELGAQSCPQHQHQRAGGGGGGVDVGGGGRSGGFDLPWDSSVRPAPSYRRCARSRAFRVERLVAGRRASRLTCRGCGLWLPPHQRARRGAGRTAHNSTAAPTLQRPTTST